jgi:hypothetical protein
MIKKLAAVCTTALLAAGLAFGGALAVSAEEAPVAPETTASEQVDSYAVEAPVEAPVEAVAPAAPVEVAAPVEAPAEAVAEAPAEPVEAATPSPEAARAGPEARTVTPITKAEYQPVIWTGSYLLDPKFPQKQPVKLAITTSLSLKVFEDWVAANGTCHTTYQGDFYLPGAATDALVASGILTGAGEQWVGGSYKSEFSTVITTPDCKPTPITPVAPVPTGPTCDTDGSYSFPAGSVPAENDGKTIANAAAGTQQVQRGYEADGHHMYVRNTTGLFGAPGDYVWQAYGIGSKGSAAYPYGTIVGGGTKAGGSVSGTFTVLPKTGVKQSTDPKAPCYEAPPVTNTVCTEFGDGGTSTNLNSNGWIDTDTRATGHPNADDRAAGNHGYVDGGLHIYTEGSTSTDKVAYTKVTSFPLKNTGKLAIDYDAKFGIKPGINLSVEFEFGRKGTLVYEDVYGQDLWLTNGSDAAVKANAPVNGGGNGSQWHGTIDQWLTKYPDAKVTALGFSLGSGVFADGVLRSITAGCNVYDFDYEAPVPPKPDVTVVAVPVTTFDCTTSTATTVTTTATTDSKLENNVWVPVVTVTTATSTRPMTDEEKKDQDCPVVVPPTEEEPPATEEPPVVVPPTSTPTPTATPTSEAPAPVKAAAKVEADQLAHTGAEIGLWVALGALLLAIGAGLVLRSRLARKN